ncbi:MULTISPECIES: outer membrane protein assembly factor BamB family protein [Nocardia]|uniref:outer membrane protein assembly factor BamB family protein n=1 Tax=Nocardia TaxID=1817 RepID=UPI001E30B574|nr:MULTISPECIES: PQQ-binding-like beta-propeller repeat protein [Nocardia]
MRIGSVRAGSGKPRLTVRAFVLSALGALVVTGCGTDVDDITVGAGLGWPAAYHDGRNGGATSVTGAKRMALSWSRPSGGPIARPVTIGSEGQLFLTTRTANGCAMLSFQMPTGRKRFCSQLGPSAVFSPSVVDGVSNVYVGDDGGVNSFNNLGQPRWRTPVAGVPVSVQFTGDGNLLTVTQSGQVDVLSRQTGHREVTTVQLLGEPDFLAHPDLARPVSGQGLDDCPTGGPQCSVANISAVDADSGRFFLTLWQPGEPVAALVALRYRDGKVVQEWRANVLSGGSGTSPAVSPDGATIYVGDNSGRLIAVDAADGRTRWVRSLGFAPRGGISVSSDGLVIPAGDDGYLLALRDKGDASEIAWERKDLALRGTPVQTAGDTGYTVAAIGAGLNLITFDTQSGDTIDSDVLPEAEGTTTGTSISADGEVVLATRLGEVFTFVPEK